MVPPLPETPLDETEFDLDVRLQPVAEKPRPGPGTYQTMDPCDTNASCAGTGCS